MTRPPSAGGAQRGGEEPQGGKLSEGFAATGRWKGRKEFIESLKQRISVEEQEGEEAVARGAVDGAGKGEGGEEPGRRRLDEVLARRGDGRKPRPAGLMVHRRERTCRRGSAASAIESLEACMRLVGASEAREEGARGGRGNLDLKRKREAGGRVRRDEAVVKKRKEAEGEVEKEPRGAGAITAAGTLEEVAGSRTGTVVDRRGGAGGGCAVRAGEGEGRMGGEVAALRGGLIEVGRGHHIARTGSVIWCRRCGGHAEARIGAVLASTCKPIQRGEKSGRAYRRNLLVRRRHPITRAALEGEEALGGVKGGAGKGEGGGGRGQVTRKEE